MAANPPTEPSWYCDICKTPFSAKSAYERHIKFNKEHLKKKGQVPSQHFCPDCNAPFSRPDLVTRHRTTAGQCSGLNIPKLSREIDIPRPQYSGNSGDHSATNNLPQVTGKRMLSISSHGIARKMQKTAACDLSTSICVPHASVTRTMFKPERSLAVQSVEMSASHPVTDNGRWNSLASGIESGTLVTDASHNKLTFMGLLPPKLSTSNGSMPRMDVSHITIPTPKPSKDLASESESLLYHMHRMEQPDFSDDHPSNNFDGDRSPQSPLQTETIIASDSFNTWNEADHWLIDAMESVSLKEDSLAHVHVQSSFSKSHVSSKSSLGSLFARRSPRLRTPMITPPSSRFSRPSARCFRSSPGIPLPMVTKAIGEEAWLNEPARFGPIADPWKSFTATPTPSTGSSSQEPRLSRTTSRSTVDTIASSPVSVEFERWLNAESYEVQFEEEQRVAEEYFKNGEHLLRCAHHGDDLEAYQLLTTEYRVDINYRSESPWCEIGPSTALVIAAGRDRYNVLYAMLQASVHRQQLHLDLLKPSKSGLTIIDVMCAPNQHSYAYWPSFQKFLRTLVAVLCCECSERVYPGSNCALTACSKRGVKSRSYTHDGECQWGRRLRENNWPQPQDILSINNYIARPRSRDIDAIRASRIPRDWYRRHWLDT